MQDRMFDFGSMGMRWEITRSTSDTAGTILRGKQRLDLATARAEVPIKASCFCRRMAMAAE